METAERALNLVWMSIAAMGMQGAAAMVTELAKAPTLGAGSIGVIGVIGVIMVFVPLAFVLGCMVGMASAPFVAFGLMNKRLTHSLPFVYIPSLGVVIAHASTHRMWQDAHITAMLAFGTVSGLSVLGFFILPNAPSLARMKGLCRKCGYSRTGLPADRACPECGTAP